MVQLRVWAAQDVMAANEIDPASSARNVLKILITTPREDAEVVYQGKVAGVQKNGVNPTSTMTSTDQCKGRPVHGIHLPGCDMLSPGQYLSS